MASKPTLESWIDRLAVRQTRRQMLKTTLAGAALTLPFARTARAYAAVPAGRTGTCKIGFAKDPKACWKGCNYFNHKQESSDLAGCARAAQISGAAVGVLVLSGLGMVLLPALQLQGDIALGKRIACENNALFTGQERAKQCLRPHCGNFNPCQENGPCADLLPDVWCCPDRASPSGYTPCAQCCNPKGDGCGSGVTQCGQK